MSEGRSGKSRAMAWTLSILAAPVLYVLSASPIYCLNARLTGWWGAPPHWLESYIVPYYRVWEHSPAAVHQFLSDYARWWSITLEVPTSPHG